MTPRGQLYKIIAVCALALSISFLLFSPTDSETRETPVEQGR